MLPLDSPAEPPSYDSLFGRIRDTHKASRNVIDFVVKVTLCFIFKTICRYLCLSSSSRLSVDICVSPVPQKSKIITGDSVAFGHHRMYHRLQHHHRHPGLLFRKNHWKHFSTQVCMIVIGSVYFHDCPAEPYIPIFLIVGGSFSVFKVNIKSNLIMTPPPSPSPYLAVPNWGAE